MKNLILVGAVFLGLNTYSQHFVAEKMDHHQVLFRGYENRIIFGQIGCPITAYDIEAINCSVLKVDDAGKTNEYILKPGNESKTAKIYFVSEGKKLDSIQFVVKNLPQPSLYWGNSKMGNGFSKSPEIRLDYGAGIGLKANFEIVSWAVVHNKAKFNGKGASLSDDILAYTDSLPVGESISITVEVMGADGITRKQKGYWTKQ